MKKFLIWTAYTIGVWAICAFGFWNTGHVAPVLIALFAAASCAAIFRWGTPDKESPHGSALSLIACIAGMCAAAIGVLGGMIDLVTPFSIAQWQMHYGTADLVGLSFDVRLLEMGVLIGLIAWLPNAYILFTKKK